MENGIKDFTDLDAWKMARKLRSEIYGVCKTLPKDESYALASQMRRAAISVTANIAEGYGRYSFQENIQFCRQSRASAYELRDHCTTALDAGYISEKAFEELNSLSLSVIKASERLYSRDQEQEGKAQRRRMMSGHYFPFSLFHFL